MIRLCLRKHGIYHYNRVHARNSSSVGVCTCPPLSKLIQNYRVRFIAIYSVYVCVFSFFLVRFGLVWSVEALALSLTLFYFIFNVRPTFSLTLSSCYWLLLV